MKIKNFFEIVNDMAEIKKTIYLLNNAEKDLINIYKEKKDPTLIINIYRIRYLKSKLIHTLE